MSIHKSEFPNKDSSKQDDEQHQKEVDLMEAIGSPVPMMNRRKMKTRHSLKKIKKAVESSDEKQSDIISSQKKGANSTGQRSEIKASQTIDDMSSYKLFKDSPMQKIIQQANMKVGEYQFMVAEVFR